MGQALPAQWKEADLTDEDVASMREWARRVILGPPPGLSKSKPEWLKKWFEVSQLDKRLALLTSRDVAAARVLVSLDMHAESVAERLRSEADEARSIAEDYRDALTFSGGHQPLPWEE